MRDDEVDDRWMALAALLLSSIEEPLDEAAPAAPRPEYVASVSDLARAQHARLTERQASRSRHPSMSQRPA